MLILSNGLIRLGFMLKQEFIHCEKDGNIYFSGSFFGKLGVWDSGNFFDDRHQATQEAIKKAVEIYNKGANYPRYCCLNYPYPFLL